MYIGLSSLLTQCSNSQLVG